MMKCTTTKYSLCQIYRSLTHYATESQIVAIITASIDREGRTTSGFPACEDKKVFLETCYRKQDAAIELIIVVVQL